MLYTVSRNLDLNLFGIERKYWVDTKGVPQGAVLGPMLFCICCLVKLKLSSLYFRAHLPTFFRHPPPQSLWAIASWMHRCINIDNCHRKPLIRTNWIRPGVYAIKIKLVYFILSRKCVWEREGWNWKKILFLCLYVCYFIRLQSKDYNCNYNWCWFYNNYP